MFPYILINYSFNGGYKPTYIKPTMILFFQYWRSIYWFNLVSNSIFPYVGNKNRCTEFQSHYASWYLQLYSYWGKNWRLGVAPKVIQFFIASSVRNQSSRNGNDPFFHVGMIRIIPYMRNFYSTVPIFPMGIPFFS